MTNIQPLLQIDDLSIEFTTRYGKLPAVRNISLSIDPGESFALIGESGSGKSTIAFAAMNHLDSNGAVSSGTVQFMGLDMLTQSDEELEQLLGDKVSMVFQDPHTSLNPCYTIGDQLCETVRYHKKISRKDAYDRAATMLEAVTIPDVHRVMKQFPHQISGGQKQRVVIAQALMCDPKLIILDEPTTALDVTTEQSFLALLDSVRKKFSTAFFYITHDLGIVSRVADRIGVIYAGQLVEYGNKEQIFTQPAHPYTVGLMDSIPNIFGPRGRRIFSMKGRLPNLMELPRGCIFYPRCPWGDEQCCRGKITLQKISASHQAACIYADRVTRHTADQEVGGSGSGLGDAGKKSILSVKKIKKEYSFKPFLAALTGSRIRNVKALDRVTINIKQGETFGLVGESGCGKSTMAKVVMRLEDRTSGDIEFEGKDIFSYKRNDPLFRKKIQIIFQNPDSSLNPFYRVKNILGHPLRLYGEVKNKTDLEHKCIELLQKVRLGENYMNRFPHELSGGEKQRVAIARAFASKPALVICDEVTSALDVSVQASIVNLLMDLQKENNTAYLFISHDLSVVRQLSHRIGVMYLGRMVEIGSTDSVFSPPYHPYTRSLLSSVSIPTLEQSIDRVLLSGSVPSADNPPSGCYFHTRCPEKYSDACHKAAPDSVEAADDHFIACHIPMIELAEKPAIFPAK